MRCKIDFKEAMTKERPLKMVDSNAAITGTLKVAMNTFTLAQGLAQKRNHQIRNHHKKVARVGYEIMNRRTNL
jgi:hypothetical protein